MVGAAKEVVIRALAQLKDEALIEAKEAVIFLSVVSLAEIQFGIERAPLAHKPGLSLWLTDLRRKLAPATEELSEPVLVRWKELLAKLSTSALEG